MINDACNGLHAKLHSTALNPVDQASTKKELEDCLKRKQRYELRSSHFSKSSEKFVQEGEMHLLALKQQ